MSCVGLFLLLATSFLIFQQNSDALRCTNTNVYDRPVTTSEIRDFISEVTESEQTSEDHEQVEKCYVTIIVMQMNDTVNITYHHNITEDETLDRLKLSTYFMLDKMFVINTLSYVCASEDYCERSFVKHWLQQLHKTDWHDVTEQLTRAAANLDQYMIDPRCMGGSTPKRCPTKVCTTRYEQLRETIGCLHENDTIVPKGIATVISMYKLVVMKNVFDAYASVIEINEGVIPESDIDEQQQFAPIFHLCKSNMCNNINTYQAIVNVTRSQYNLRHIINLKGAQEEPASIRHTDGTNGSSFVKAFHRSTIIIVFVANILLGSCY